MKLNRIRINCLVFTIFTLTFGCAGPSVHSSVRTSAEYKIEKVNLGDSAKQVESLWGTPEQGVEKYPSNEFKVLTYLNNDGNPEAFFTVDPQTSRVVSKSLWIVPGSPLYNLDNALTTRFKGVEWKKYVPCNTRSSEDKILVNHQLGLYLATEKDRAVLVSWLTPELAKIRTDLLFKSCPGLQTESN